MVALLSLPSSPTILLPGRQRIIPLRPYQQRGQQTVLNAYYHGKRRMVLELPTGAGKTILAFSILQLFLHPDSYALFLLPSIDLVEQTYEEALKWFPAYKVGRVQGEYNELGRQITIASVDTLAIEDRRNQLLAAQGHQRFDVVDVDEAHGALCVSYEIVLACLATPEALVLGMTATPYRQDRKSLLQIFPDGLCYYVDILDLIAQGWLISPVARRFDTNFNAGNLSIESIYGEDDDEEKMSRSQAKIMRRIEQSNRYEVAYAAWDQWIGGGPTLVYANDIHDAQGILGYFNKKDVTCRLVTGKTNPELRKEWYEQFNTGELPILVNYNVLKQGVDFPNCMGILIMRFSLMREETCNRGLHTQIIGRITRPSKLRAPDGSPLKTEGKVAYLTDKDHQYIPLVASMGCLPGTTEHEKPSFSLHRSLQEELKQDEAEERTEQSSPLEEEEQIGKKATLDLSLRIGELRSRAASVFTGEGWKQELNGDFRKETPYGTLVAERAGVARYVCYLVSEKSGRRSIIPGQEEGPQSADMACARGTAHLARQEAIAQAGSGAKPEILGKELITRGDQEYLLKRKGLTLDQKNLAKMTKREYYRIDFLLKERSKPDVPFYMINWEYGKPVRTWVLSPKKR